MEISQTQFPRLRAVALKAANAAGAPDGWAEEFADEAIARLFQQDPPPERPFGWVRTTARNLAIDAHRKRPKHGWGAMPVSAPGPGEDPYPTNFREPSPSEAGRAAAKFGSYLRKLPDVLSLIEIELLLGQAQGASVKELAEHHGYTEGTVRTMLSNARKKLHAAFPDRDLRP